MPARRGANERCSAAAVSATLIKSDYVLKVILHPLANVIFMYCGCYVRFNTRR